VALGIAGPGAYSLDAAWGIALPANLRDLVLALAAVGYLWAMISSASAVKAVASKAA